MVWFGDGRELEDVVMSGGYCSLTYALWNQEEIEQLVPGDLGVHNGTWSRVYESASLL